MLLIKTLAGVSLFAAVGAAVGYSKILCVGGECQITGTPFGGAFIGAILGMAVISSFNAPHAAPSEAVNEDTNDNADGSDD